MNKLSLIVGTRPNFVKAAAIIREFKRRDNLSFEWNLVHTGQHYDYEMDKAQFESLRLPEPDFFMYCGGGPVGYHIGQVIERTEYALKCLDSDSVMVFGDVNTALGAAITARKMGKLLLHIEAGLRSGDMSMSEEQNRVIVDILSDELFVTEDAGLHRLLKERMINNRNIHLVGDVMIDVLKETLWWVATVTPMISIFAVLTLHRPENVDDPEKYESILKAINKLGINVKYLVHPRNKNILNDITFQNIEFMSPSPYHEFILLCKNASVIITDSGGLQSEALYMGVPCLTLRYVTEKPETVECGGNILVGTDWEGIKKGFDWAMNWSKSLALPPLYDGKAAKRIVDILEGL